MFFHLRFWCTKKMAGLKDQCVCSWLNFNAGKNATETFRMLEVAFGEQAVDSNQMFLVKNMLQCYRTANCTHCRIISYKQTNLWFQTYTGSILVAVNPYQVLPIYTSKEVALYKDRKLGELPPHIFAIGDSSFSDMKRFQENQCVVIRCMFWLRWN